MTVIAEKYGFTAYCTDAEQILIRSDNHQSKQKVTEFDFYFSATDSAAISGIKIEYSFPARDIAGMWHPTCGTDRTIRADWSSGIQTMLSCSAPVVCFFDNSSRNVQTYALSETQQKVISFYGIHEEDGQILCKIIIDHRKITGERHYQVKIWESSAHEAYWNTLQKVRMFWENNENYRIPKASDTAKMPLYSFWYSMHQNVNAENIEQECRLAANMGFSTIIVDDGWQTDDNQRGYAFCGDWIPSATKFPNFPAHVKRIQSLGIRYMLWFSVPFIGRNSAAFQKFRNMLLAYDPNNQAGILDIRYPEARQYLIDIYVKAVKNWGIDGLKLDFIDEFYLREESPAVNSRMDYEDLQQALECLLTDIFRELRAIKPEILIEFRQKYIGPEIRKFGNMLRVVDCPGSALSNRIGIVDLRLLSGSTAVHSDMLMWHPQETVENAALQLISCLFGTVQISVLLEELDAEKKSVLTFWIGFMKQHRKLLQESVLEPLQPQNLYPMIRACSHDEGEAILVAYAENHYLSLDGVNQPKFYYINAGGEGIHLICGHPAKTAEYRLLTCAGKEILQGVLAPGEISKIRISEAGMLQFRLY